MNATTQRESPSAPGEATAPSPPGMTHTLRSAVRGWERFWFEPQQTSTLAVVRILFGLAMIGWTVTLIPDADAFFSPTGVLPAQPQYTVSGIWSLLGSSPGSTTVMALLLATLLASICLTVGLATRLAAVVVWLGLMAFTRRDPSVVNSGDIYLRVLAFFLILAPSGAALSVDRLRRGRRDFWQFPARSPWALRLIQVQISILYLSALWDKLRSGSLWNGGTALSYIERIGDVRRFPLPLFNTDSVPISLMTYGSLAVELGLGVLVWNRRARPWVLALGIGLHLSIDYSIRVGFFSAAAIAGILAFLPPEWAGARLLGIRNRLGPRRPSPAANPNR